MKPKKFNEDQIVAMNVMYWLLSRNKITVSDFLTWLTEPPKKVKVKRA